jgi:hypothetical protein
MLDNNQYNKIDRLVIIDAGVRDSEILASGVVKEAAVAILEANKNGIDQINDILALQPHIESLHLISHGNPGCIFLGNTELSLNTLDLYTEQISQWSIPQILLYGCQVAAGDAGAEFIEKLQQLSGAEIAASTSLTGDASQGGNWLLEIATGEATFDLALEPTAMEAYQHTLVTIDGNSPTFDGNIFNTGYNGAGGQQSPSLADAVWEVSNLIDYANLPQPQPLTTSNPFDTTVVTSWSPADVVDVEPRQWVQSPFGASQWISYNPPTGTSETTHAGNKDLYFRYNFDLQNFDPTAFALQLDFYADNDVFEIYVNGVAQSPNVAAIALNNSTDTDTRKSYTAIGYVANAKLSAELKNNWQVGTNEIIVHVKSGATRVGFLADFDVTKTKPIVDLDGDNSSGTVSSNYKNTFTAGGSSINIVDTDIKILDNTQGDTTKKQIQSVTFTLTNPQAGDELLVGTLPNGITPTTVNQGGQIIVTLTTGTGTGSISDYIAALKEIKFNNSIGNDPDNTDRLINVAITDGNGNVSSTATSTIVVLDGVTNQPPAIGSDGGGDTATKDVPENTTTVTTVTSTDPNAGDTLTYSIVGGTDGAKFQIDPTTGALSFITAPNFEAPTDTDGNNSYVVQVQVADGKGGTDTQTLTVNVTNANEPPVITSDGGGTTATKGVPENTTTVTTVTSTDPDNDTPTYSIVGGTDGAKFQIDPTTGALSFITAPNFEAPTDADGNNSYVVQVQVADGKGGTDTQTLTVNVTDVNETVPNQPPLIGSDGGGDTATKGITENTTTVTTVTSTDPNNDTPSYSIVGGTDGAKFQIDPTTGALSFITAPDFEAPTDADGNNSYVVQVQVADGKGGTDTQTLTVNVTNVDETLPNQAPAITSGNNGQPVVVSTPENTVPVPYQVAATDPNGDPLTYSINPEVGDGNLFTIDPQGNISFKTAPDFELPTDGDQNNSYVIQVAVSDGKGGTDVQDVTINVTDLDENAPTVSIVSPSPTKDTTPPLTGTVDDPEATVTVNIDGKDYPAINNGDGTWTIPDDTIDPLPGDGTYPTKVTAVDKAGNSAVDDGAVIIDTTAPTVTVDRKRTNDGTPELTGTVNDPNAIVKVTVNGVEYTATNNGTTWTIPNDTIAPALVSNTYDVTATATDPAGNAGTDGTTGELVVDSTAIDVTLNTPPNNDTTPTLTGSVSKPNAAVKVKIGDTEYPAINNGDGTWTLPGENIAPALADGRYPVLVTATDDLGNTGSTEGNLTIDNTPPTVTINTLVTNDSTPVLTGTVSEPVSNLEITVNGNTYTATVNGTNWTIPNNTIAPPLPDSVYDVGATATDLSGNVGQDTTTGELTIDTTAPSAPTITSPTRTDDTTPKIEGGATPNTDLLVDIDLNNDGIPDATYSTKSDAQGNWSIDLGTATPISGQKPTLKNGDRFGVSALALDSLGNRSTRANQTVEIIPLATVTDDTVNAALSGSTPIDVLANDSEGLKIVSVTPPTGGGKVTIDDNGTPNDPSDDRLLYTPPASGLALQRSSGQNIFRIVGDGSSPAFTDTFTYTVQDPNGTTRTATVNANVPANASGGTTGLEFAYLNADASCNNEVGFFKVDDDAGTINGVAPSDPNYVQTALSSGRVIFSAINDSAFNDDRTRILDGFSSEDRINFFLVRGGTVDGVLDDLEAGTNAAPVYFGSPSGNENDYNAATISDAEGGGFTIDWEDSGDGDDDFNDTSIQVKLTNATAPLGSNLQGDRERELLDLSSTTSDTAATFQVGSNASFNNTVGFYRVQNAEGAIVDEVTGATINPGDANYAKVAVRQSINAVNKNSNGASGSFEAGAIYAPVIVSNASLAEFISQNPDNIASDEDINAYFSYMGANPDKTDHVRLLGDNTFGFEDQFQGGDLDFNDFIVKVNFSVDEPLLTIA